MGKQKDKAPVRIGAGALVMRPIGELVPYARAARIHSAAQIARLRASLREFGFVTPVLVDAAGNVIAGHARLAAALAEGMQTVPCVLVEHLTDIQRRAYILADNRLAEGAEWDPRMLALELRELEELDFDITLTGFAPKDLAEMDSDTEAEEDDFDPAPPKEPVTCPGDLWLLGRHRLLCGDAVSAEDVSRLMDGHAADLLLTDPPYGVSYRGKTGARLAFANDGLEDEAFTAFLTVSFRTAGEQLKPGSAFYVWHADSRAAPFHTALGAAGLTVRQGLVWVKRTISGGTSPASTAGRTAPPTTGAATAARLPSSSSTGRRAAGSTRP